MKSHSHSIHVNFNHDQSLLFTISGSRGAVKDRGQNGFPTVQLRGYDPNKVAVLQVFVGSDTGTPIPHLYYQACRVSGKNSTQCR